MMDAFSYLSILLSIILGLAITQVLQGYRALLLARGRVKLSAPVLIWSVLILLFAAQAWWASFDLRERTHWDFLSFAVILLQMVLLYMLAALVFPDIEPGGSLDLAEHSGKYRRAFYGFLIAMLVTSVAKTLITAHRLPSPANLGFHLLLMTFAIAGIFGKSHRLQVAIALGAAIAFLAYVALLFANL
ncbi:MAG TPA: hypothetical protein VHU79_02045 [Sphingomicrobium sp.]|jgi:hypothetical protein|nr:hypothetical protein [Sphingomicrobium sp.]